RESRRGQAGTYHNMGMVYEDLLRHHDDALDTFRKALAIQEEVVRADPNDPIARRFLANHHSCIGVALDSKGQQPEAVTARERALAIRIPLARDNPAVALYQNDVAEDCRQLGRLHRLLGEPARALRALEQALAIQEKVVRAHPEGTEYRRVLALTRNS